MTDPGSRLACVGGQHEASDRISNRAGTARAGRLGRPVCLLDADQELGDCISRSERAIARRAAVTRAIWVPPGPWIAERRPSAHAHLGYLVVAGLVSRELQVAGGRSVELIGAGDILRPWQEDAASFCDSRYRAIVATHLAVLDEGFAVNGVVSGHLRATSSKGHHRDSRPSQSWLRAPEEKDMSRTRLTALPVAILGPLVGVSFEGIALGGSTEAATQKRITPAPDRGGVELRGARKLARTIVANRRWIRGASFSALPPFGDPAAMSTKRLAGFPRHGRSFAILSSGDATLADNKNVDGSTGIENGGPSIRGSRDVTIYRITLRVPTNARCLSVRFRFLSEEFPEFINTVYNDAFIAELDVSNWNTVSKEDPKVIAPRNFAADANGNPISVNAVGDASVKASRAKGTTYDAATRRLRASTPVSPGRHILYMSIFDQGDRAYDSAVFIDRLTLNRRTPCESGAVKD